jgi:hypothetical protein
MIDTNALSVLRTPYVGNNSAVGKIVDVLPPLGDELTQRFFSIGDDYGTGHAPYTLTLYYEQDGTERNITVMPKNAALLFALIDNLEEVNFAFRNTPSGGELDKAAYTSRIAVNKEQIGDFIGSLGLTWEDFQNDFEMAATLVFEQSESAGTNETTARAMAQEYIDALAGGRDLAGNEDGLAVFDRLLDRQRLYISYVRTTTRIANAYECGIAYDAPLGTREISLFIIFEYGAAPQYYCPYARYGAQSDIVLETYLDYLRGNDAASLARWLSVDSDGRGFTNDARERLDYYAQYDLSSADIYSFGFDGETWQFVYILFDADGYAFEIRLNCGDGLVMPAGISDGDTFYYSPLYQDWLQANGTRFSKSAHGYGYITNFNAAARTFDFDTVRWLGTPDNDAELTELGINPNSLSNGYYIYNPDTTSFNVTVAQDCKFYISLEAQPAEVGYEEFAQG